MKAISFIFLFLIECCPFFLNNWLSCIVLISSLFVIPFEFFECQTLFYYSTGIKELFIKELFFTTAEYVYNKITAWFSSILNQLIKHFLVFNKPVAIINQMNWLTNYWKKILKHIKVIREPYLYMHNCLLFMKSNWISIFIFYF